MPKTKPTESVLHDWVHALTFQMQALLLTAMRGPDGCEKHNSAKVIIRYLRGAVIKPAGNWSGQNDNDFMWGDYRYFTGFWQTFYNDHDGYPHHFIMHLIHCAQVVGFKHHDNSIKKQWLDFYYSMCKSMHMSPESEEQLNSRLNDFGAGYHNA